MRAPERGVQLAITPEISLKQEIGPDEISLIARESGLSDPERIREVEKRLVSLIQGLWALERLKKIGKSPREQLDYIKGVREHLRALTRAFRTTDPVINRTFGAALEMPLSRILGDEGLAWIWPGVIPAPNVRDRDLPKRRRESNEVFDEARRMRIVNVHCIEVLLRLVQAIDQPLTDILEIEKYRKDRGGPRRNIYRVRIIEESADIFKNAGLHPTTTAAGLFENFCAEILQVLGLPTEGLRDAIVRYLPR